MNKVQFLPLQGQAKEGSEKSLLGPQCLEITVHNSNMIQKQTLDIQAHDCFYIGKQRPQILAGVE